MALSRTAPTLKDSRVLEIGCGTGSMAVALAEQGARVTAVDKDSTSIKISQERCRLYGVDAEFHVLDASTSALGDQFGEFDLIIFDGSLEHMTYSERLDTLALAWRTLPEGKMLAVTDTPNRLWYLDEHTSNLPFFHWLPDELAAEYLRHAQGEDIFDDDKKKSTLELIRKGRGVSFHEFELAIDGFLDFEIIGDLTSFRYSREPAFKTYWDGSEKKAFHEQLKLIKFDLSPAFCNQSLDFILKKGTSPFPT